MPAARASAQRRAGMWVGRREHGPQAILNEHLLYQTMGSHHIWYGVKNCLRVGSAGHSPRFGHSHARLQGRQIETHGGQPRTQPTQTASANGVEVDADTRLSTLRWPSPYGRDVSLVSEIASRRQRITSPKRFEVKGGSSKRRAMELERRQSNLETQPDLQPHCVMGDDWHRTKPC
jgi:hypothetical protein